MKKLGLMVAVAAFAIFAVLDLIHSFVTDDPIGYFSQDPSRLLWVGGIAITGGLVTWAFYKMPPRAQGHARMLSLGAVASAATATLGFLAFSIFSLASIASKHGGSFWSPLLMFLPVLFILLAVAIFCWIACWRVWRRGATQREGPTNRIQ